MRDSAAALCPQVMGRLQATGRLRATRGSRSTALCALGAAVVALTAGCLSRTAATIEQGLIGMSSSDIRACLGDIQLVEPGDGETQVWGFVRPYEGQVADIEISLATGEGTGFKRPTVEAGNPEEASGILDGGRDRRVEAGSCLYLFEIHDGKVAEVRLRGRSFTNMNADAECAVSIRRCVPEASSK
jgi:hypothetical protein